MSHLVKEYLREKLAKDKLSAVLNYLADAKNPIEEDIRQEAIMIGGRFESLGKKVRAGVLNHDEEWVERNKIRNSLGELLNQLPDELMLNQKTPEEKQADWWIRGIAYLLLGTVVLIMAFRPKKNLRIEAEVLVDRVSMTHISGNYNLGGASVNQAGISGFSEVIVEGDSFAIDEEGMGEISRPQPLTSSITFTPYPESPNVVLPMTGNLKLEELHINSGAYVTLHLPNASEEPELLSLIVEQEEEITGMFSYLHRVKLIPEQVNATGIPDWETFFSPVDLWLTGPKDSRREMRFDAGSGSLTMDLIIDQSIEPDGVNLTIKDPVFLRKDESENDPTLTSTVLGGIIRMKEADKSPLRIDTLVTRRALNLQSNEPLNLENLRVTEEGIYLYLSGYMDHIGVGPRDESLNPSLFSWLWYNYNLPFLGIGFFLSLLIFFLPKMIKRQ